MSKTGIIYKLVSRDVNIKGIYVGSTCNFRTRKYHHKGYCDDEKGKNYNITVYQYIRANGGWDSFDMVQIEEFKHDTKQELHARERHWIEQLKATLNKVIPTRTRQERYQNNKEAILEKKKQYQQNNKAVISEKRKQYYQNNKEVISDRVKQYYQDNTAAIAERDRQYYQNNKEMLSEKAKQYRQNNKEVIANKRKHKYTCECGSTISISNKSCHNKSVKHLAWVAAEIIEA